MIEVQTQQVIQVRSLRNKIRKVSISSDCGPSPRPNNNDSEIQNMTDLIEMEQHTEDVPVIATIVSQNSWVPGQSTNTDNNIDDMFQVQETVTKSAESSSRTSFPNFSKEAWNEGEAAALACEESNRKSKNGGKMQKLFRQFKTIKLRTPIIRDRYKNKVQKL
ncbi:uncharacterized protein LOC144448544 isoform X2 [Glandiceps talaboti]